MNINMSVECGVCLEITDVRLGFSNRKSQPLRFICEVCNSPIDLTLTLFPAGYDLQIKGGEIKEIEDRATFGQEKFTDLHLDFPAMVGKYILGMTPFMRASKETTHPMGVAIFGNKIDGLNFFYEKKSEISLIIKLYHGKNKQLFKTRVEKLIGINTGKSLKPEDINLVLYTFLSELFAPFLETSKVSQYVVELADFTQSLNQESLQDYIKHLFSTGFLQNTQKNCLSLYPQIYEAELALRPAIFLDEIKEYDRKKIAARVSTADFTTYKDLYKDVVEVIDKELTILAGINNIHNRGGFAIFKENKDGKAISSLEKFAERSLAKKLEYLLDDNCWYDLDKRFIDNHLRNGIAHYTIDYDEYTQIITYYKDANSIIKKDAEDMYFLDFMRLILEAFREMHSLHHLIKCLYYYKYLIMDK